MKAILNGDLSKWDFHLETGERKKKIIPCFMSEIVMEDVKEYIKVKCFIATHSRRQIWMGSINISKDNKEQSARRDWEICNFIGEEFRTVNPICLVHMMQLYSRGWIKGLS